jgi:hypothetical protein
VASYGGRNPSRIRDPAVVGHPRVQMLSLRATGIPASGGVSSRSTLAIGSTWEVGGTSRRSSASSWWKWSRMLPSWTRNVSRSSLDSSGRLSRATWSTVCSSIMRGSQPPGDVFVQHV